MPSIVVEKRFKRRMRHKPSSMQAAIARTIKLLADDPRHPGLRAHRVQGTGGVWEAYVDESNRVTFQYGPDGEILMRNHCSHDIISRSP